MDAALCDNNQYMFSHVLFSLLYAGFPGRQNNKKNQVSFKYKLCDCVHSMSVNEHRVKPSSSYI